MFDHSRDYSLGRREPVTGTQVQQLQIFPAPVVIGCGNHLIQYHIEKMYLYYLILL